MEVIYNIDKKIRTREEFDYLGEFMLGSHLSGVLRSLLSGPWKGDRVIIVSENSWAKQRSELRRCGCESNPYKARCLDVYDTEGMNLTVNNGIAYYDGLNSTILGVTHEDGNIKINKADLLIEMLLVSRDRSDFARAEREYKGKWAGHNIRDGDQACESLDTFRNDAELIDNIVRKKVKVPPAGLTYAEVEMLRESA